MGSILGWLPVFPRWYLEQWGAAGYSCGGAALAGISVAVWKSNWRAFLILASLVLTAVLVAVSGIMRGKVQGEALDIVIYSAAIAQLFVVGAALYLARRDLLAPLLMVPLCVTAWLTAWLIAAMSFQNVWL